MHEYKYMYFIYPFNVAFISSILYACNAMHRYIKLWNSVQIFTICIYNCKAVNSFYLNKCIYFMLCNKLMSFILVYKLAK